MRVNEVNGGDGSRLSPVPLSARSLCPVLLSLDSTGWKGGARRLTCYFCCLLLIGPGSGVRGLSASHKAR